MSHSPRLPLFLRRSSICAIAACVPLLQGCDVSTSCALVEPDRPSNPTFVDELNSLVPELGRLSSRAEAASLCRRARSIIEEGESGWGMLERDGFRARFHALFEWNRYAHGGAEPSDEAAAHEICTLQRSHYGPFACNPYPPANSYMRRSLYRAVVEARRPLFELSGDLDSLVISGERFCDEAALLPSPESRRAADLRLEPLRRDLYDKIRQLRRRLAVLRSEGWYDRGCRHLEEIRARAGELAVESIVRSSGRMTTADRTLGSGQSVPPPSGTSSTPAY